jgi:hypothetical protein
MRIGTLTPPPLLDEASSDARVLVASDMKN